MRPLILLAAALLAGCAAQPSVDLTLSGSAQVGPAVFATLATNDCQVQTAPFYTAATVEAHRATRAVKAGQLGLDQAQRVLVLGERAKAALDAACLRSSTTADATQLALADGAIRAMRDSLGGVR